MAPRNQPSLLISKKLQEHRRFLLDLCLKIRRRKIINRGSDLLDCRDTVRILEYLGKALDNAKSAYEDGEKKLQPSGQSILQTCNKLVKLGAKQSDRNPLPQLMDVDDVPALGDAEGL